MTSHICGDRCVQWLVNRGILDMDNAEKFVRTVQVTSIVGTLLLAVLAYTAERSLSRIDKISDRMEEISRNVAVQQVILMGHDRWIEAREVHGTLPRIGK